MQPTGRELASIQPTVQQSVKEEAVKEVSKGGGKVSRRSSLRSFNFGRKNKARSRKGSLRNDAYTIVAIKQHVMQQVGDNVQMPICLLDDQKERLHAVHTTAKEALDTFASRLDIMVPDVLSCLAIFDKRGSKFRRLLPTEKIYAVSWEDTQEHLEDEGHKLIRRATYKPNDRLESLVNSSNSASTVRFV